MIQDPRSKSFSPEKQNAFGARFEAQKIAFGPVVFQCVRYAWKRGMLQALADAGGAGLTIEAMAATGRWSAYALKVALQSCLSAGVVSLRENRYVLGMTGFCVISDQVTQVNMDFIHDVCYRGLHDLDRSLDEQRPHGLKSLGEWSTLYEGLSVLPEPARSSWFAFDHCYSDASFPVVLPDVFATNPRRILDIGANTGRFACAALAYHPSVEIDLVDKAAQLAVAGESLARAGLRERARLHAADLLDAAAPFPGAMDVVWLSQLLSCFGEGDIASILSRAADALAPGGQVLVLDTLWDRQRFDIATFCLINTSPYFTAIASGNSKVYETADYLRAAKSAGLTLVTVRDDIGYCHSLLRFARAGAAR